MREVPASDVSTNFPELLDDVERRETVVITRHGHAVARLVPEVPRRRGDIDAAIASIKARRKRLGKITVEELLSARHEHHRY